MPDGLNFSGHISKASFPGALVEVLSHFDDQAISKPR